MRTMLLAAYVGIALLLMLYVLWQYLKADEDGVDTWLISMSLGLIWPLLAVTETVARIIEYRDKLLNNDKEA